MRVQLVFSAWLDKDSRPLPNFSEKGLELTLSDFRAGSTFGAKIDLDLDAADDLRDALAEGYAPMFYATTHAGPITEDEHRAKQKERLEP